MADDQYTKEEINYRLQVILDKLEEHNDSHKQILEQVIYTNGKVKKLTLVLTALGAYVLGVSEIGLVQLLNLLV